MNHFLHLCSSLKPGGITNFVVDVVDLNSSSDSVHDVAIYMNRKYSTRKEVIDLSGKRFNVVGLFKFGREVKRKYKLVYVHGADYLITMIFLLINVPCVFFQHGMSVSHGGAFKSSLKKYWFSVLPYLFRTKVICSSEFALKKSRSLGIHIPSNKTSLIQFGTNIGRRVGFTPMKDGAIIIGTAGRLAKIKRFDKLLEAFIGYKPKHSVILKIAGEGPEKDRLVTLSKEIKSKNIEVQFLGHVSDMIEFYDELDLFLFPSHNESYGLVVLESLFRNVPVVLAKDIGGALHLIDDRKNGVVLENVDDALSNYLEFIDSNPTSIESMKEYITDLDLGNYKIERTRSELEGLV